MSKLALANGDDHPDAAAKHLADAAALLTAARPDGAAYLSGYVVECSLKSIYHLEKKTAAPWEHDLAKLRNQVMAIATVAGATTAKYFGAATSGLLASPIAAWDPGMRYRAPSMTAADALSWHRTASQVFQETIAEMIKDGVV